MNSLRALPIMAGLCTLMSAFAYGAQIPEHDATWKAPESAAARLNPLVGRTDAAAGGGKLFQQRCATCHGEDGRGASKAPGLRDRHVQAQGDGELFWKISGGNSRSGMPSFSFLPEAQRWQLVLHLRAIAAPDAAAR